MAGSNDASRIQSHSRNEIHSRIQSPRYQCRDYRASQDSAPLENSKRDSGPLLLVKLHANRDCDDQEEAEQWTTDPRVAPNISGAAPMQREE